jgi:hypothetical protein
VGDSTHCDSVTTTAYTALVQVNNLIAEVYGDTGNTHAALVESAEALEVPNALLSTPGSLVGSQGAVAAAAAATPARRRGRPPKSRVASAPADGQHAKGLEGRLGPSSRGQAGNDALGARPPWKAGPVFLLTSMFWFLLLGLYSVFPVVLECS